MPAGDPPPSWFSAPAIREYDPPRTWPPQDFVEDMRQEILSLSAQLADEKAMTRIREAEAFEKGLRSAAAVHRENQMLVHLVSMLIDRQHTALLRASTVPTAAPTAPPPATKR